MASAAERAARGVAKYRARTAIAGPDFKQGIKDAEGTWKSRTAESQDAYNTGVQAGIAINKFSVNVEATPKEKYGDSITPAVVTKYTSGTSLNAPKLLPVIARTIGVVESTRERLGPPPPHGTDARIAQASEFMLDLRNEARARRGE